MNNKIKWLVDNFYGALNLSGSKNAITKRAKKAGAYSDDVSTDTRQNLKNSSLKVGNKIRRNINSN